MSTADISDGSIRDVGQGPGSFRRVPKTGVIFVTTEARRLGFSAESTDWCNLGQGMPETGPLLSGPPRVTEMAVRAEDCEYSPIAGIPELRDAIAQLYNGLFRRGMPSQYSAENVAISGGGRASLTRLAAALGQINLGHFLPDYTAYEELLDVFRLFSPIPILLERDSDYDFSPQSLQKEILGRGLGAILLSNPSNPTGKLISGDTLREWVRVATKAQCTLLLDEFYSHYVWPKNKADAPHGISTAASFVKDVDSDPVVIVDGLTKNWRYPGFRVTWTLGPKKVMEAVSSAGSFLDGGASRPMQRAAIPLLDRDSTLQETAAINKVFGEKREFLLQGLQDLGFRVSSKPCGTFYVWASAEDLPHASK